MSLIIKKLIDDLTKHYTGFTVTEIDDNSKLLLTVEKVWEDTIEIVLSLDNNIVEFDDYMLQNPDLEELIIFILEEELFKCL